MNTRTAHRNDTSHTHPAYYCGDCQRAHNGSTVDARSILGDRGTLGRIAYAWSARRGAYNLVCPVSALESSRVALASLSRVVNAKYAGRAHAITRTQQPASIVDSTVRVRTGDWRAFADAYDTQRSYSGACISGFCA